MGVVASRKSREMLVNFKSGEWAYCPTYVPLDLRIGFKSAFLAKINKQYLFGKKVPFAFDALTGICSPFLREMAQRPGQDWSSTNGDHISWTALPYFESVSWLVSARDFLFHT